MNKPDYTPAFRSETPGIESKSAALKPRSDGSLAPIDVLAEVPALDVWLANLRSPQTRKAYRKDVVDFIESLDVHSHEELYRVKPAAVLAWRHMLEGRELKASTIRRKLAALSSLFTHLVAQHLCEFNPVRDIKRPSISRGKGSTASFSQEQARKILNAPPSDTVIHEVGADPPFTAPCGSPHAASASRGILLVGSPINFHRLVGHPGSKLFDKSFDVMKNNVLVLGS